ncbi:MAG: hypothetical protein WC733_09770, partial [Methylophilus sp.]
MNNQKIQADFKEDLLNISTLKFELLSAKAFYSPWLMYCIKSFGCLFSGNVLLILLFSLLGLYQRDLMLIDLITVFIMSGLITLMSSAFLHTYILFGGMVAGQLKSEAFIRYKFKQLMVLFLSIYFTLMTVYLGIAAFGNANIV